MGAVPTFLEAVEYAESRHAQLDFAALGASGIHKRPIDYYLLGTYPPLKAMTEIGKDEVFREASGKYNVYVHIPFCHQYCSFCHFAKDINAPESRVARYLNALYAELALVRRELGGPVSCETLYCGGGTPSTLTPREIEALFANLRAHLTFLPGAELTFELHPNVIHQADVEQRVQVLKSAGINRWVCGVQSMDNTVLRQLNRGHTDQDVCDFVELMESNGCRNLSLDLIYGLPYQTLENWYSTITRLIGGGINKFNIYPLMFKISDPITQHYYKRPEIFPSERDRTLMHFMADFILTNSAFEYGPVFFYSKLGRHSRQQESKYEQIEDVNLLGFGVSAFGYVGHTQYHNLCTIDEYIDCVNRGIPPLWKGFTLCEDERMRRSIMFAMKSKGVVRSEYRLRYGKDPVEAFSAEFNQLFKLGLVSESDGVLRLTTNGILFADGISHFFVSEDIKRRSREANRDLLSRTSRNNEIERYDFSAIERINDQLIEAKYGAAAR